jgi:PPOX class probable F420-dependent enzyme
METRASRPYMPGYGIVGPEEGGGLLPWSWAVERIERAHDYWVATTWPDGRPHVMPVWGAWHDDAIWFSCSRRSRKAVNLAREPRCAVSTDVASEPVVVEGLAEIVDDRAVIERLTAIWNEKYDTDTPVDFFASPDNACIRVAPARVIGLSEANFNGSPTRWEMT